MKEETKSQVKRYFDISETRNRVGKLKVIFRQYLQSAVSKENFRELVRQVLKVMPQDLSSQKIQDSLAHLHGRPLTEQVINETAWRLSGNTDSLRNGEIVTQDIALRKEGWCALQIVASRPLLRNPKSKSKKTRGCSFTCFVLCGYAAGYVVEKFFSLKHLKYLANDFGFTPPFKNYPFKDERELFGMRFGALFSPSLVVEGKPSFNEIHISQAMVTWNKQILKKRNRENFDCSLVKTAEQLPCFRCWRGTESCLAAVHTKDFQQDFCPFCNKESTFDPDSIGYALDMCVNCQRHEDTTGLTLRRHTENADRA
jgi:hypothetical protein